MLKKVLFLLFLLFLNAIFSAWEMTVSSINQNRLKLNLEDGDIKASLIKNVINNPNKVLASFQIYISIITIFSSVYATFNFANYTSTLLRKNIFLLGSFSDIAIIVFMTFILSFLIVLFGEFIPKNIALKRPNFIFNICAVPMYFSYIVAKPFLQIFSFLTKLTVGMFGVSPEILKECITEEEIKIMIGASGGTGSIDKSEVEMIHNVFKFDNKVAGEIATHRKDIVAININDDMENIVKIITEEKYSRIPLYEDNIDNIVGILHIKDILKYLVKPSNEIIIDFDSIKRTVHFLPYLKKTDELFKEMQKNKVFMVVIVDEYGGTSGIVTMEDLIEEIMGNIFDEYDDEEIPDIETVNENTFFISGTASLDVVADFLHIDLSSEDYATLSGFLIGKIGHIPRGDEKTEVEHENIIFQVNKVKERRIVRALVIKKDYI